MTITCIRTWRDTSGITTGTFTIANRGETSANVFYRVYLTVRDSSGLTHTSSVDVRPLTSVVRIESNVTNAQLTLDGAPITAPFSFTGVEGVIRTLGRGDAADLGRHHVRLRVLVRWRAGDARDHDAQQRYDVHRAVPARGDRRTCSATTSSQREAGRSPRAPTRRREAAGSAAIRSRRTSNGVTLQLGTCDGPSVNCFITGLSAGIGGGVRRCGRRA